MRKFCGNCEKFNEIYQKKELREFQIKELKIKDEITVLICQHCGEEVYDKETEIANDIVLFDSYRKNHF